jgi:hypothetical protein
MRSGSIIFALFASLLLAASLASAQTGDSYTLSIYAPGGTAPVSSAPLASADITCNLAPTSPAVTVNPKAFQWDDPAVTGRACVWRQSGAGPIVALPTPGVYEATITRTTSAGTAPESARAPFSTAPLPAAVTGLRPLR